MVLKAVVFLGGVCAGKSSAVAALFELLTGKHPSDIGEDLNPTCLCASYGVMGRWRRGMACPGWDALKRRGGAADVVLGRDCVTLVDSHSAAPSVIRSLRPPARRLVLLQPSDAVRRARLLVRSLDHSHSVTYFKRLPGLRGVQPDVVFNMGTPEKIAVLVCEQFSLKPCRCFVEQNQ